MKLFLPDRKVGAIMILIELWVCELFLQFFVHHGDFFNSLLGALQLSTGCNAQLASGLFDFWLFRGFLRRRAAEKKIAIGREILVKRCDPTARDQPQTVGYER